MRVAFRVDASVAMGLGHVRRCLALAQEVRVLGAEVLFVTRTMGIDSADYIASAGFPVQVLSAVAPNAEFRSEAGGEPAHASWAGIGWRADVEETVARLRAGGTPCAWLVVDHYAFDGRWHRLAASELGVRIAVIDDLADRPLFADLLVDQNLAKQDHPQKYREHIERQCPILGGPRYALLGSAYALAPPCAANDPVNSIGIFLGGTDPAGLSERALRACREELGFSGAIELVTTKANPRHFDLQALAARWPKTTVTLDLPDLAEFFARHDLQIGAGGGATWERCRLGAPTLVLVGAANQSAGVALLEKAGAAAALPRDEKPTAKAIAVALRALLADPVLRRKLGSRAGALVDGWGARRVALRLCADTLRVRRASLADSSLMHRWRNDPATRNVSTNPAEISFSDHQQWLTNTLADPRRLLLIGEVGDRALGVIRFDLPAGGAEAEVSLYVDPLLHGLGLGTSLLRAGEAAARDWGGKGLGFVAAVLSKNSGSRRMFESAGYQFSGERGRKRPYQETLAS